MVRERQLVVVQDGTHASELDLAALGHVVVLEVGLQQQPVLTDDFT